MVQRTYVTQSSRTALDRNVTDAEIRTAYCAIVTAIVEPGRARGVDQNMAVSAGFLMAREDARSGFASNDVRMGAFDQFCPPRPPQWDHATMGRAITGIVLEGAGL